MAGLFLPFRYGQLEEGVYRGAYPKVRNQNFLKRLKLKSVLSLIPEQPNPDLVKFCKLNEINNLWIRVSKPKENVPLSYSKIIRCLQVIINPENSPIYIHCIDGTVVTGIVIACLRKLQMWTVTSCLQEFLRYHDEEVITSEETEFVRGFKSPIDINLPVPSWLWPSINLINNSHFTHPTIPCNLILQPMKIMLDENESGNEMDKSVLEKSSGNEYENLEVKSEQEAIDNKELENKESEVDLSRIVQALALEGIDN